MTRKTAWIVFLFVFLPLLLAASTEGHAEEHGSPGGEFIGKVINFTILFGGLGFLLRKPMKTFFSEFSHRIDRTIREAEQAERDGRADLDGVQARLASLSREVGDIESTAEEEGREDQARIRSAAETEADRIKRLAEQEIGAVARHGLKDIRAFAAELACSKALERIESKLTPEIHARLIDRSINRLADTHEKSNAH